MRWGCPLRRSPHGWGSSLPPCEPPCSASTGKFMWRIAASFWNSWAPRHEMCSWRKSSGEGEGFSGVAVHDSPTDRRVVVTIPCERVRVTSAAGLCAVALLCVGTLPIGLSATRWGTAPRVPRRARVHAVSREPDLLGDGARRLAGVAQQRGPGPGGGLCCAHAGQPPGPLPPDRASRPRPPSTGACHSCSPITSWILHYLMVVRTGVAVSNGVDPCVGLALARGTGLVSVLLGDCTSRVWIAWTRRFHYER